jgi:CMP-N,N'-diacetyllegionaminic acid synthase
MLDVLGLITARGGSKELPHKNILPIAGKPLIAWTIEAASRCESIHKIVLSTDDDEIARIALEYGAETLFMRPSNLAEDTSDHVMVVIHALEWLAENEGLIPEYVFLLQPTSPLRTSEDIDNAVELASERNADAVIGVHEFKWHPSLAKQIDNDGRLKAFQTIRKTPLRRQDLERLFYPNGAVYLFRREVILQQRTFFPENTYAYVMPRERSIDIDTLLDLQLAEYILQVQHESP